MSEEHHKRHLAYHIYKYLCKESQNTDLSDATRESLTAASECIDQAYGISNDIIGISREIRDLNSDDLLDIFTRHKEFIAQGQHHHETQSSNKLEKPDIRIINSHQSNDTQCNSNPNSPGATNNSQIVQTTSTSTTNNQQHYQHTISQLPMTTRRKLSHLRAQIKRQASKAARSRLEKRSSVAGDGSNLSPLHQAKDQQQHKDQQQQHSGEGSGSRGQQKQSGSHHHPIGVSVHQKNFKQKLIALIKKFRTDGSDFDSEEQYREALERELMKAAAGRGSRDIEELLEEEIDVEDESASETEDWDNISESSTPKPSLRPFFSSTTLDKAVQEH